MGNKKAKKGTAPVCAKGTDKNDKVLSSLADVVILSLVLCEHLKKTMDMMTAGQVLGIKKMIVAKPCVKKEAPKKPCAKQIAVKKPCKKKVATKKVADAFSNEEKAKIAKFRKNGWSIKKIGKAIHRRDKTVAAYLHTFEKAAKKH